MIFIAIVGSVAFLCSMLVVPLIWSVPDRFRTIGRMAGVAAVSVSLCLCGGQLRNLGEAGIGIFAGLAVHFALTAWREFGDRRMEQRAEAYQARIDAERGAT